MSTERQEPQRGVPENPQIENVLAMRYASRPMRQLFSAENKVILHQDYWTEIMQGQHDLGIPIPQVHIDDYRGASDIVDLTQIKDRELVLRHDEKAMIETFNANAGGHQDAHRQLTSRDISDNIEMYQNKTGLEIIRGKMVGILARQARLAAENSSIVYGDRTHNAHAQPNLIGKLIANSGEEFLRAFDKTEEFIESYPMRGLKGAMGTQTDLLQLFDGDQSKVDALEKRIADKYGFKNILNSIGQVYPRSLDFELVSLLHTISSAPGNLAITLRHMAGRDQFTEGFKEGQVGSSAMPHKMNSRTLERVAGFKDLLAGYTTMAGAVSGVQWYGGDVSNSVTRRVFLPDSFFAVDGQMENFMTVLDEGGFYPAVINAELEKYLPFLTTTRLLVAATQNGVGREDAHAAIRDHAVEAALEMRQKGDMGKDLIERLVADPRMERVSEDEFRLALSNPIEFVGSAPEQIIRFVKKAEDVIRKYPEEANYVPEPIL